jgi:hypothetical protein
MRAALRSILGLAVFVVALLFCTAAIFASIGNETAFSAAYAFTPTRRFST